MDPSARARQAVGRCSDMGNHRWQLAKWRQPNCAGQQGQGFGKNVFPHKFNSLAGIVRVALRAPIDYVRELVAPHSPGRLGIITMDDLRTRISDALKQAMKDKAADRLSTLRLINAAIKDRDIDLRGDGRDEGVDDGEVLAILGKMLKQRGESAKAYEEGSRLDLAERERAEMKIIEEFLPRQLSDDEVAKAVDAAISEIGADSIRDMGKVMGALKSKYTGQMDFGSVGPQVKDRLCG